MSRVRIHDDRTRGERIADKAAEAIGSWAFVISQTVCILVWLLANTSHALGLLPVWDEPPFILLNLMLSFQAAFTGPVLLLAANRQAAKDRELAARDDEEIGLLLELQHKQMRHDEQTKKDLAAIARALKAEIGRA